MKASKLNVSLAGASLPAAPALTATGSPAYFLLGNDSYFGWSGVITPPGTLGSLAGCLVEASLSGLGQWTTLATVSISSSSPISWTGGQFPQPTTTGVSYDLRFTPLNSAWKPTTSSPYIISAISVTQSAVTSVSATLGITKVDPVTRQLHQLINVTPTLAGNIVAQSVSVWISQDGGTTYVPYDIFHYGTVGQVIVLDQIAPTASENWQVKCATGWHQDLLPISTAVASSAVVIPALPLPIATGIHDITIPAGVAGSWPYNNVTSDGTQDWLIPPFTIDDTPALSDNNSYACQITRQPLTASKGAITGAPEAIFAGFQIGIASGTYTSAALESDYLNAISYMRYRVYLINRAEKVTNTGWTDLVNVGTLQIGGTGNLNLGYLDVELSVGGGVPPGLIKMDRADPTTVDPNSFYVDGTVLTQAADGTNNLIVNSTFDQGALGINAWIVSSSYGALAPVTGATLTSVNEGAGTTLATMTGKLTSTTGGAYIGQVYPTKPGKMYYMHSYFRVTRIAPTPYNVLCLVTFLDNTGAAIGSPTFTSISATAGWQQPVSYTSPAAPALAAQVLFQFGVNNGFLSTDEVEWDSPTVNEQIAPGNGTTPNGSGGLAINLASNPGLQFISGQVSVNLTGSNLTVNGSGGLDINGVPLTKLNSGNIPAGVTYVGSIAATQILAGTLVAGVIYSGTITCSQLNVGTLTGFTLNTATLNSVTINSGSITISTSAGTATIGSTSSGLQVTSGADVGYFNSGGVSVTDGIRTTSMSASAMSICGVSCFGVAQPGWYIGPGIVTAGNITGATITGGGFVAAGNTGGSFTFHDLAGVLHTVVHGLLIT